MTVLRLVAYALLSLAAGGAITGLVQLPLRLIERLLISLVVAMVIAPAATYGLALLFGLNATTVLLGPALVFAASAAVLIARADPAAAWRVSWSESMRGWRSHRPRAMIVLTVASAAVFGLLFAHTLFTTGTDLSAGFATVWADWSQHLTTENSFAVAGNVSTANPLYAGTPLLYPFIADFQSAELVSLGVAPAAALAVPGAVLAVALTLLIVRVAARLGLGLGAGVIAAAITFIGGGLGFTAVFSDACHAAGYAATQCAVTHVISNPGDGIHVVAATLQKVPGIIAAQPRAYDGLLTPAAQQPFPNMQWYTPLFAWWLPQRTLLYGFATALTVLLIVITAVREQSRSWSAYAVAGLLLGVMPLVHAQAMIALVIVLLAVAATRVRRDWLVLAGVAAVLALPRLVQIALAPHGSAAAGNSYPWLEPGWLSGAVAHATPSGAGAAVAYAVGGLIRAVLTPRWWGFWFVNLGVAVPLSALVAAAAAGRYLPGRAGAVGRRLLRPFPPLLIPLALGGLAIFVLCNMIVFQSWDWDNTKLLVFWYFTAGLLVGALASHWWRRGFFRPLGSLVMVGATVLTGVVVLVRLLPWTPPASAVGGPFTVASADERTLAATVAAMTPGTAVFLTYGRPNDPLLTLAGRTGLMGYYGWLWSYGIDFGTRVTDVQTMYRGCAAGAACPVHDLLHRYHVSYVEVDDRVNSPGAIEPAVNTVWWASQHLPIVASTTHIVVYDVRRL